MEGTSNERGGEGDWNGWRIGWLVRFEKHLAADLLPVSQ